jgi:hypothetical protein
MVSYIFFIYYYKECFKLYNKYGFALFFNLAAIGILIFPFVSYNILLDRLNYYLFGFRFIIFAFYAHYFLIVTKKKEITKLIMLLFMTLLFLQFLTMIYSGSNGISPFQFISNF